MDVAILGVGSDGQRYASACAAVGWGVSLCGEDANAVVDAVEALAAGNGDAIDGTTDLPAAVDGADAVIETRSFEQSRARELLAEIEDHAPEDALLAVTVESATVTALAVALRNPDRLVGLHETGLTGTIEVVVADQSSDRTAQRAIEFVEDLGWTAVRVRDAPGFVSDRLRLAVMAEAIRLYEQGVAEPTAIDRTLSVDGEIGPLELADREGLDGVLKALEDLESMAGSRYEPPALLRKKVEDGQLGRDHGSGFYDWDSDEPTGQFDD